MLQGIGTKIIVLNFNLIHQKYYFFNSATLIGFFYCRKSELYPKGSFSKVQHSWTFIIALDVNLICEKYNFSIVQHLCTAVVTQHVNLT